MQVPDTIKRTPLHEKHVELGARLAPFAGFEMPIRYAGIVDEHLAVRTRAGLFDVSHMGEVFVRGPHAFDFVQQLVTNDASRLYDGRAMYTVMCHEGGGIIDDLIVYRLSEEEYMFVVNAANREKDLNWMVQNNAAKAEIEDRSDGIALMALQGPHAFRIMSRLFDSPWEDLRFYHFRSLPAGAFLGCQFALIAHTGYTGEAGVEIYCDAEAAGSVWDAVMDAGADLGLLPAGLAARDSLRIEAGYCLYGNELTEDVNPLEAGLGWLTKLEKEDFIGRASLEKISREGPKRRLVGFVLQERAIPRAGYPILDERQEEVGVVTSGTQSPVMNQGVGLGFVPNEPFLTQPGAEILISIRGRPVRALVKKPPLHS